jgi:hypothetical protein
MAITNIRKVQRVEVYPIADSTADDTSNAKHESIMVVYKHTFDDSEDASLPVSTETVIYLGKFVSDGGLATDLSGEDALVQTVCGAIWS